jgi:hypothetical protein
MFCLFFADVFDSKVLNAIRRKLDYCYVASGFSILWTLEAQRSGYALLFPSNNNWSKKYLTIVYSYFAYKIIFLNY